MCKLFVICNNFLIFTESSEYEKKQLTYKKCPLKWGVPQSQMRLNMNNRKYRPGIEIKCLQLGVFPAECPVKEV